MTNASTEGSIDPAKKCPVCGVRLWEVVSCTMDGCPRPKEEQDAAFAKLLADMGKAI